MDPLSTEQKLDMDLDEIMSARKAQQQQPPQEENEEMEEDPGEKRAGDDRSRRVYVSNLPWSTSWQDLKDFFRQAGKVVYADVMTEDGGRSKGCGVVEFETADEAQRAIDELHDAELDGRRLAVREDREEKPFAAGKRNREYAERPTTNGGRRVFASNLSWSTSWQDLKDYFRQAGKVAYASVMTEDDTGRSKGCGIVEFETPDEAARAIELLHDTELDARRIAVREDREEDKRASPARNTQRPPRQQHDPPASGAEVVRVGRRVYVGNLSWSTSWQDLKDFFRKAGNVVYASVMTEDDTGRSKGFGIVEFESSEQAVCAIETLHDTELDGRRLTVREDREDKDLKGRDSGRRHGGQRRVRSRTHQ